MNTNTFRKLWEINDSIKIFPTKKNCADGWAECDETGLLGAAQDEAQPQN